MKQQKGESLLLTGGVVCSETST